MEPKPKSRAFSEYLIALAIRMRKEDQSAYREFGGLFGPLLQEVFLDTGLDLKEAERRVTVTLSEIALRIAEGEIADPSVFGSYLGQAIRGDHEYSRQSELTDAATIQARLCRTGSRQARGLQIQFATRPARILNGDLHDAIEFVDGRTLVVVGDSVGKGAGAAIYSALALGAIRTWATRCPSPGDLLRNLNELLLPHTETRDSLSLCAAVWDPSLSVLTIANAGMPRPLILRSGELVQVPVEGMPLGWFRTAAYESIRQPLDKGEVCMFHSDGLGEDASWAEAFSGILQRGRQLEIAQLSSALMAAASDERADDQTLVLLRPARTRE